MACALQLLHQLVQQHHLAAGQHQPVHSVCIVLCAAVLGLGALKQEGVVAALLQLGDDVEEGDLAALGPLQAACDGVQGFTCKSLLLRKHACMTAQQPCTSALQEVDRAVGSVQHSSCGIPAGLGWPAYCQRAKRARQQLGPHLRQPVGGVKHFVTALQHQWLPARLPQSPLLSHRHLQPLDRGVTCSPS